MYRTLAGSLLLLPLALSAQAGQDALLWSLSGPGLSATSFVYGTVHSKDERAYTFVHAVEQAMVGVNSVAGELDLAATRNKAVSLMGRMMLPGEQRLQDLYKKKDWAVVDAYLRSELDYMAPMVQRMKPFFVMATITEQIMGGSRPRVLDEHLMEHAKARGHRVFGLETLEEQLRAMDALPVKEQAMLLLEQAHRTDQRGELEAMMEAYAQQDLAGLMTLSEQSGALNGGMEQALLTDRNHVLAHRMDSVLRADGSALFLVGAAHLPGEEGVLQLLRAKGFVLEAVAMEPMEEPFPPARLLDKGIHYTNDTLGYRLDMPAVPAAGPHGSRSIGYRNGDEGVLVTIQTLNNKDPDREVVDLLADEFELKGPATAEEVQGFRAARGMVDWDGSEADVLLVRKRTDAFVVIAIYPDPEVRRQVLDSFRFMEEPE